MISNDVIKLVKFTETERDFYTQIYSNKDLMKYITKPLDKAACHRSFDLILRRMVCEQYILSPCVIVQSDTNKKVGIISLRKISDKIDTCEIGIIILKTYQRQKFAHHAKSLLVQETFIQSKAAKIIAICEKSNTAANQANLKLGFKIADEFLDTKDNILKIQWHITKQDI